MTSNPENTQTIYEETEQDRLSTTKPPVVNKLEYLRSLVSGFEIGQVFMTALDLDVFSQLEKPQTADELSAESGTDAALTRNLLNVLSAMELLKKEDETYYNNPETAPFLIRSSPYFGRYLKPDDKSMDTLLRLKQILIEGPQGDDSKKHEHRFNEDAMDWIARYSLLGRLQGTVGQITALPEFKNAKKLVDLGGGHGLFGIALAQENPNLEVVIFDRPEVVPTTEKYIRQYNMEGRVCALGGDYMTDDIGNDYDMVFEACSFGGNDQRCQTLFQKIAAAMKKGGLFIRLTFTLDDDEKGPLELTLWDLKNSLAGRGPRSHRTNSGLSLILEQAGFVYQKTIDMSPWCFNPMRLIISRKE